MTKPTFDEWHMNKYHTTFEDLHLGEGELYDDAFRAMMRDIRDYVSEIVETNNDQ